MPQFVAPGVYILERDFSDYVASLQSTSVGMVGTASKGPLNAPTLCTSTEQFINIFGVPTINQYGPYAAVNYLRRGNTLWYVRVAKEYVTSAAVLSTSALANTRTLTLDTSNPYEAGDFVRVTERGKRSSQNMLVSEVNALVVTLDPDGPALLDTYTVAASIDRCLRDDNPDPSNASAHAEVMAYGRVRVPTPGGSQTLTTPLVAGGTVLAGATNVLPGLTDDIVLGFGGKVLASAALMPVVKFTARDPGAWANFGTNRGVEVVVEDGGQFSNINPITSLPFQSGGVNLQGIMPSAHSVDTKAQLLALTSADRVVVGQTRGVNRDESNEGLAVVYRCATVTSSSSTWTAIGLLTKRVRVFYQGRQVEVFDNLIGYDSESPNYWDKVIGSPSGTPISKYIYAEYLQTNGQQPICTYDSVKYPYNPRLIMGQTEGVAVDVSGSGYVNAFPQAQGHDGSDPNAAAYIGIVSPTGVVTGLQTFRRTEQYDINLVCVPSITTASVLQEIIALCEYRNDCLGILDPPFGLSPQEVTDWHNGTGVYSGDHSAFVSNKAALYWPWVKQFDPYSQQELWMPPTSILPGVISYSDHSGEIWYAPAGITRGRVPNALTVEYHATQGDVELIYGPGNGNAVNAILSFAKDGIVVYGQRTLQRTASALDRVNVRRLLFFIEKSVATTARVLAFEQNDPVLWSRFTAMVTPFLSSLRGRRALEWFQVVCDVTTNPPERRNNNEMGAKIYLIPTKTAEKIILDFTLLASGTNVSEFITQDANNNP